jgi:PadR family transcriptional regulator, regulatory protein PadR
MNRPSSPPRAGVPAGEADSEARWPTEWLRGVLELCVLGVLTEGPAHGYALAVRLEDAGLGAVKGGTLYPLLTRLETEGLVTSSWQAGTGGPGRKVFVLTEAGSTEALRRTARWAQFTERTRRLLPVPDTDPADLSLLSLLEER